MMDPSFDTRPLPWDAIERELARGGDFAWAALENAVQHQPDWRRVASICERWLGSVKPIERKRAVWALFDLSRRGPEECSAITPVLSRVALDAELGEHAGRALEHLRDDPPAKRPFLQDTARPLPREEAQRLLSAGTPDERAHALWLIAKHEPDWRWAQDVCLAWLDAEHFATRKNAIQGLEHVIMTHWKADSEKVKAALKAIDAPDLGEELRADVEMALLAVERYANKEPDRRWGPLCRVLGWFANDDDEPALRNVRDEASADPLSAKAVRAQIRAIIPDETADVVLFVQAFANRHVDYDRAKACDFLREIDSALAAGIDDSLNKTK